jgi:sulfur carrier protein
MKLVINGEELEFPDGSTIEDILGKLQVRDKVMASAVNMEIVKEAEWKSFVPNEGDKIEFLQFVGGG